MKTDLVALREARGLSVRAAAARLGVAHSWLWKVERGQSRPTLPQAIRIARFYGLRVEDIWGDEWET